jgi:hypothetical protein
MEPMLKAPTLEARTLKEPTLEARTLKEPTLKGRMLKGPTLMGLRAEGPRKTIRSMELSKEPHSHLLLEASSLEPTAPWNSLVGSSHDASMIGIQPCRNVRRNLSHAPPAAAIRRR